jgi:hypothetical protein
MSENVTEPNTTSKKASGNSGSNPKADPVTPIDVGTLDDIAGLAIDQSHLDELVNPEAESSNVEYGRPPKGIFFTVKPEAGKPYKNRAFFFILELEGRDPYFIPEAIAKQKSEEDTIRPIFLVRYVTMAGDEGMWPLRINMPDRRANAFNTTAMNIMELATKGWVRIVSTKKHYRHQISKKTLEEVPPKWTDRSFNDLVRIVTKDRVVNTLNHEIWDELDNGSTKYPLRTRGSNRQ